MSLVITLAAILISAALLLNELFQSRLGVPCMPTLPRVREKMLACADIKAGEKIVELGSGWGGLALAAAKAYPGCAVTGLELSPVPYAVSRLRLKLNPGVKNLSFRRENFFAAPLEGVNVTLCYLTNPLMALLKEKFERELPPGARVVSSTFFVAGWEPTAALDVPGLWSTRIFMYRKDA